MRREPAIIVTGASRGIGAAIALELARRDVTVACVSRSGSLPEQSEAVRDRLVGYRCDVTDAPAVVRVTEAFAEHAGGISGLVNNAGAHFEAAADEVQPRDLLRMFEHNCVGALLFAQAARPHLARREGVIVGIGSFFDKLGAKGSLAYSASKAALASIDRTLAVEWGGEGISVFTVAPGYILTDLNAAWLSDPETQRRMERRIPVRRIGGPAEIGRLVAALMLDDIGFLSGETIYVDGGQSVRP